MGQHLIVVRDDLADLGDAKLLRERQWRELPQPAEQPVGCPAREHDLAIGLDPEGRPREQRQLASGLSLLDAGQLAGATQCLRAARAREWTHQAARRGRGADRRAELHEALVQIARREVLRQGRHELASRLPDRAHADRRLDVVLDRERAREHARHVAIDERCALAERDRGDRASRVGSDPGHAAQLARARRKARPDRLGPGVQIARARVVAEAGPRGEHVVERRRRERLDRRESPHPALPVRDHGRDPRLLQHDLADPDRVGIGRAPPRQIAPHAREVASHGRRDRVHDRVVSRGRRRCNPRSPCLLSQVAGFAAPAPRYARCTTRWDEANDQRSARDGDGWGWRAGCQLDQAAAGRVEHHRAELEPDAEDGAGDRWRVRLDELAVVTASRAPERRSTRTARRRRPCHCGARRRSDRSADPVLRRAGRTSRDRSRASCRTSSAS